MPVEPAMCVFRFLISVSVCLGSNGFVSNAASPLSSPVGVDARGNEPLPLSSSELNRRGAKVATLTNLFFPSVSFPAQVANLEYFNVSLFTRKLCCLFLLISLIKNPTHMGPKEDTTIPSYLSMKYFT